jgi:signal transduction histidine kinase
MLASSPAKQSSRGIRPQDVAWLILFLALGIASPDRSDAEIELLSAIAVFQVIEPRIAWFQTDRGILAAISLKLLLAYLLIGVTGGLTSSYYLILMVPVVAAATTLGAWGTLTVSLVACGSYLSFLLFIDWSRYVIPPHEVRELGLRVLLFGVLALLMHQLSAATREQARQYAETARELAAANQNLAAAEAAVRRSDRLAALGQLTAGLAHELRNPLGTMKASAEMLLRQLSDDRGVPRELAGYIRDEVDRTDSLVTRFLDFARPLKPQLAPGDVNELADLAIKQLERRSPPLPVSFVRNYSPDIPHIQFDSQLMERVLLNLLSNAAEASPPGGVVTIKTRAAAAGVEIAVIDRGSGIDPAQLESIFNPFFTTKAGGVGLGLAIVSKIVDEHGGHVTVESEQSQGSVFRVWLPAKGSK